MYSKLINDLPTNDTTTRVDPINSAVNLSPKENKKYFGVAAVVIGFYFVLKMCKIKVW